MIQWQAGALRINTSVRRLELEDCNVGPEIVGAFSKVLEENANGRYLLAYPLVGRKSYSRARRGQQQTAVACAKYAWQVHTEQTGKECPIPANFFDD